ncbi:MAG: redoxin domain-containing protein [Candidatus Eisenbacteria bacterium]
MRPTAIRRLVLTLTLLLALPSVTRADIAVGATGPAFTKSVLGGGTATLSQYSGKVVILFLLGYGCPICQSDGPSVQQNLNAYYEQQRPGEVQVLGSDLWNGTAAQLAQFKTLTGAQFPLLLNGAIATGGNMSISYGPYDDYVVLDQQGVVRYHAALTYAHGNRYHLDEIRSIVDGLLPTLDAPGNGRANLALAVSPHPARGPVSVSFTLPQAESDVSVEVLDTAGRRVAVLHQGPAAAGVLRLTWSRAEAVQAGLYFVRARAGGEQLRQRVVILK